MSLTDHPAMTCREFVERVTEYLEGALSAPDVARLQAHLDYCPPCVEYLEQMRTTLALTGRLREADAPASHARDELMAAFRRRRS